MISEFEQHFVERAEWRNKALKKIEQIDSDRAQSKGLKDFPLDSIIFFAYFTNLSKAFSEIEKNLNDADVENLSHLPIHTMAWILAMEADERKVTINPHKEGSLSVGAPDYQHLRSIYITIKMPWGQELSVSPVDPWNERYANYGDQLLTKKEEV